MKIYTKDYINSLSIVEQLQFYKDRFSYQHCELDGCGHELHGDWVIYKDTPYCENCYNWLADEERENAKREVNKLEQELQKARDKYSELLR